MLKFKQYKTYNFLICYDISDPTRLRKIAKILEQEATRIQKSIFLYIQSIPNDMKILLSSLDEIMTNEDDIRVYKIDINHSINLKSAIDLKQPFII